MQRLSDRAITDANKSEAEWNCIQLSLQSSKHISAHQSEDGDKRQAAGLEVTPVPAHAAAAVPQVKLAA